MVNIKKKKLREKVLKNLIIKQKKLNKKNFKLIAKDSRKKILRKYLMYFKNYYKYLDVELKPKQILGKSTSNFHKTLYQNITSKNFSKKKKKKLIAKKNLVQLKKKKDQKLSLRNSIKQYVRNAKLIQMKITQNNIFLNLKSLKKKIILYSLTSGVKKIKISKKTLKFNSRMLLHLFITKIKSFKIEKILFINLVIPKYLRHTITQTFITRFRYLSLYFFINPKKCFNGCRVKKIRRKKRRRFQVFTE